MRGAGRSKPFGTSVGQPRYTIATTVVSLGNPQNFATASLVPFGHDDQKLARPSAVAPSNNICTAAATASRFSAVRKSESPISEPTTRTTGARVNFPRVFSSRGPDSPCVAMTSAQTEPSCNRDLPRTSVKIHGQVSLWFGAQVASSHSCWTTDESRSNSRLMRRLVRRCRTSWAKSANNMTNSCAGRHSSHPNFPCARRLRLRRSWSCGETTCSIPPTFRGPSPCCRRAGERACQR